MSGFVSVYGLKSDGVDLQDLALNTTATSTTLCSSSQTPDKAVDGSLSGGLNDKWCSSVPSPWLEVDLGASYNITRFVVDHAGAGGAAFNLNTAAFNIQVRTDGVNYMMVANVTGNLLSVTTNDIAPNSARFVRLNVITPSQSGDLLPGFTIFRFLVLSPARPRTSRFQ
jgi:hypothetical protein